MEKTKGKGKMCTKRVNFTNIWDKVFKNGPSKTCGRQPLKHLKGNVLIVTVEKKRESFLF